MKYAALLFLILPPLASAGEMIKITKTKEEIEFRLGDALVTRYHIGEKVAKPYFWPLHAKGDITVTRAWPMKEGDAQETKDHVHQKSAWFCHGDVIPEGIDLKNKIKGVDGVDFWSEAKGHGNIVCTKIGDPLTKDAAKEESWGTGDPGHKIKAEFNEKPHVRGVVSMARSQYPDSAGSQFFVCLGDAKFLDRNYTAFGQLIKGDDVLGKIGDAATRQAGGAEKSRPVNRIGVESVKIVPADSVK